MEKFISEDEKGEKKQEAPLDGVTTFDDEKFDSQFRNKAPGYNKNNTMETARHPDAPLTNPGYSPKENYEVIGLQNANALVNEINHQLAVKENEILDQLLQNEGYSGKVRKYRELKEVVERTEIETAEFQAVSNELKAKILENADIQELLKVQETRQKNLANQRRKVDEMYVSEF